MSVSLVERKNGGRLRVVASGSRGAIELDAGERMQLIRQAVVLAFKPSLTLIAPFAVTVALEYSDFGEDGQDTQAYRWIAVMATRAEAEMLQRAANQELELTRFAARAEIPAVPELEYDTSARPVLTPTAALRDLRWTMLAHESDNSLRHSPKYWQAMGFVPDNADPDDFRWHTFDAEKVDLSALQKATAAWSPLSRACLRVWLAGQPMEAVRACNGVEPAKKPKRKAKP